VSHSSTYHDGGLRVTFVHDQSLSGDVRIVLGYEDPVPGEPRELTVPKATLIEFVAGLVRGERRSRLESASALEILGVE